MSKRSGYQRVILQVSDEFFAFAEAMARAGGYFGPADYLNAILNTAILTEIDIPPVLPPPDEEDLIAEDVGGGLRLATISTMTFHFEGAMMMDARTKENAVLEGLDSQADETLHAVIERAKSLLAIRKNKRQAEALAEIRQA